MGGDIKNILFITLSCVGDAVMTTPVLQALHEACPKATIDIVADKRSDVIFQHCPYRGEIFHKFKDRFLRGVPALIRQLSGKRYDIIVDLRTDGMAYLLNGRKRYTKWGGRSYGAHAIESLMGVIREVHGGKSLPPTHIWLAEDNEIFAGKVIAELPGKNILAISPGCGGKNPAKFWPTKNYTQLANNLSDILDGVVFLGGPDDGQLTREIIAGLCLAHIDMCNKTDLLQAAAILQRATLFVGSDSGLGHVAGAVGTATLSFFSTDKPERCLPWGPAADWIMGKDRDARKISVEEAEDKIRKLLSTVKCG